MRTLLHGLLNLNKEDLSIHLTAENEGCYTVQDTHLAFLYSIHFLSTAAH